MKRSPLIILFITIFIDLLGFGLILPNIPLYIQQYGGKPWVGGVLLSCFSITQFLFAPIWGKLSDRVGRRPMILLSLIGSAISLFFFGWAPNLAVLFVARIAAGVLSSASLPTAQAYIADVTRPENRAGGMAVIGAAFGFGFALGPVAGGVLAQHPFPHVSALAMPAYCAAALSLVNFVMAVFLLPETNQHRKEAAAKTDKGMLDVFPSIGRALANPLFGAQLAVFAFATFAFTAVESSFSWLVVLRFHDVILQSAAQSWDRTHADRLFASLPERAVPGAFSQHDLFERAAAGATTSVFIIVGVTILITQIAVMAGLAKRVGERKLVVFGSALLTCCLIGVAFAPSLLILRILSALIAVGNGVLNPSLTALITKNAGPTNQGEISGAQQSLGSLARIIAPPINNTLVGISTGIPFLSSAALMGVAFFLSLRLSAKIPSATTNQPR